MTKPNISADVAAFLAKGGSIKVCAIGERTDVIERAIAEQQALERGYATYRVDPVDQRHDAGYAVFNGLGEPVYLGA